MRRLAAFDIETTGIDPQSDRIVTAAVSLAGDARPTVDHDWLVDPGVEIPAGATAVHGITTDHARAEGRASAEAVEEITAVLAAQLLDHVPVIAFNARFDLTCLDREARRHGVVPLVDRVGGPDGLIVVDPFVLDKQFDRYRRGKRTLGAVCEHYRVRLDAAHTANADAIAAARVAWRLAQAIAELRQTELRALHGQQVLWAAEQAASLEQYFREQGNDEQVERDWPIVALPAPVAAGEPAAEPVASHAHEQPTLFALAA
ncbi:Exonuclease RNase T and DNA polymerase III [Conexibacter woesei DSM 14684]|uniref:Exonuclease RNase T and DNA polymerase III n=2 Tax=Conexibacter TaxID=191494 RepID=D3FDN7_CONWI|nr:Exonuclease RNase T and DNA polymerase III [Conexibacter woesei DSM 14684]